MMIKHLIAPLIALSGAAAIATPAHAMNNTPAKPPADCSSGSLLFGELQVIRVDISPPCQLNLAMWPRRLHGETPQERCDDMGGQLKRTKKLILCLDIDY